MSRSEASSVGFQVVTPSVSSVYNALSYAPAIVLTLIGETCPEPFIHNAEKAAYI